ncbi:hypothetical protein Bca52824_033074 [Brassica carinata]|uniref:Uncharacterized protein n=1 Tax=Brassica carinata TaxID=52824 RepID=A0A8X7SDT8_BRACI|nr:hypothetical protein Bca52824_033074 [Brassica carinata]
MTKDEEQPENLGQDLEMNLDQHTSEKDLETSPKVSIVRYKHDDIDQHPSWTNCQDICLNQNREDQTHPDADQYDMPWYKDTKSQLSSGETHHNDEETWNPEDEPDDSFGTDSEHDEEAISEAGRNVTLVLAEEDEVENDGRPNHDERLKENQEQQLACPQNVEEDARSIKRTQAAKEQIILQLAETIWEQELRIP